MTLFTSIFGSKDEIGYIKEIDKDIHKEVRFFLELEEACHIKVKLANAFASTWNKEDLSALKKQLRGLRSVIRKGEKILLRFQQRLREQDSDLLQVVHISNKMFERSEQGYNIFPDLKKLEEVLNLEYRTLARQLQIINQPLDHLLQSKNQINELLLSLRIFLLPLDDIFQELLLNKLNPA